MADIEDIQKKTRKLFDKIDKTVVEVNRMNIRDIELLFSFNVVQIVSDKKMMVATSNKAFVKRFKDLTEKKTTKGITKKITKPISSSSNHILVFDMLTGKTISLTGKFMVLRHETITKDAENIDNIIERMKSVFAENKNKVNRNKDSKK